MIFNVETIATPSILQAEVSKETHNENMCHLLLLCHWTSVLYWQYDWKRWSNKGTSVDGLHNTLNKQFIHQTTTEIVQ